MPIAILVYILALYIGSRVPWTPSSRVSVQQIGRISDFFLNAVGHKVNWTVVADSASHVTKQNLPFSKAEQH